MDINKCTKKELIWIIEELQRMAKLSQECKDEYLEKNNAWAAVGALEFLLKQVLNVEGYADMIDFKRFISEAEDA